MKQLRFYFIFSILLPLIAAADIKLKSAWGGQIESDQEIEAIIALPIMQRLKHIDQSGPIAYWQLAPKFSRYDHSIGVYLLLKKAGVSKKELIAGLLHDASHTAFSHVGDHLFYHDNGKKSYQDIIHLEFLQNHQLEQQLAGAQISITDLDPDIPLYKALEQPLPDLCADRIQYLVHTGVLFSIINKQEARYIIDSLTFENDKWVFTELDAAKKLAELSLLLTEGLYGASWNLAFYQYFADILKSAIKLGIITEQEIKHGTDHLILAKLRESSDISYKLNNLRQIGALYSVTEYGKGEFNFKPKFRGVDPYIVAESGKQRLTTLDRDYKKQFDRVKNWCNNGYGISFIPSSKIAP